jgi:hypothetical protein
MSNRKPLYAVGEAVLKQLQTEAMLERQTDDDLPNVPDLFDSQASAQSRRAMRFEVLA